MVYNTYESVLLPAELLMKSLEAVVHVIAVIEISALLLIVILLAIIAWSGDGEFRLPDPNLPLARVAEPKRAAQADL